MTQQEHLNRIRARCVELLSIWDNKRDHNPLYNATCGKEAEAGWRATVAAIDGIEEMDETTHLHSFITSNIIASWPTELL
jgi:hypothetical protein